MKKINVLGLAKTNKSKFLSIKFVFFNIDNKGLFS